MRSASATEYPFPVIVGLFPSVFSIIFPWTASFPYLKGQERKSELAVPCMTMKLRAACEGKHAPNHAPMPAARQQCSSHPAAAWGRGEENFACKIYWGQQEGPTALCSTVWVSTAVGIKQGLVRVKESQVVWKALTGALCSHVTCNIVTSSGRKCHQKIRLKVKEK